jgi:hypothetical protein
VIFITINGNWFDSLVWYRYIIWINFQPQANNNWRWQKIWSRCQNDITSCKNCSNIILLMCLTIKNGESVKLFKKKTLDIDQLLESILMDLAINLTQNLSTLAIINLHLFVDSHYLLLDICRKLNECKLSILKINTTYSKKSIEKKNSNSRQTGSFKSIEGRPLYSLIHCSLRISNSGHSKWRKLSSF